MEVKTPDRLEYQFFPVRLFRKRLAIRAAHDAHISFTSSGSDTTPMVEIFLGAWENTKSVIRFNREGSDKAEVDTPGLLNEHEHREFLFEWTPSGTVFQVYGGYDPTPFLSWRNFNQPFPVTHFGVRTAFGATGDWICDDANFIESADTLEYNYNPVEPVGGCINFKVRAANDAHVALTSGPMDGLPLHEIVFGGWENSRCAIRHNRERPGVVEFDITKPLNKDSFQSFWIDWSARDVRVGIGNVPDPFMVWNPRTVHPITHFGILTSYGSDGTWIIPSEFSPDAVTADDSVQVCPCPEPFPAKPQPPIGWVDPNLRPEGVVPPTDSELSQAGRAFEKISLGGGLDWVPAQGGYIPERAVVGGQDDGEPIFVARARHDHDLIPGKLVASHRVTYVAWGGGEHGKDSYEVLVADSGSIAWVADSGGSVPDNAIHGGETDGGETLFIGRAPHKSTLTVGKIHPSHGNLYISYGGKEIGFPAYEVLVKI